MTTDNLRLLYAYNRWANDRVLEAAAALSDDQLRRDLGSSYRSVWDTLVHIVWGEWRWLGRWQQLPHGPGMNPAACGDLPGLRHRWLDLATKQTTFLESLDPPALERPLTYENPSGMRWTYPLGLTLRHLVNHSTYHRGQVTTMLRQLGAEPVATDLLVYIDELAESGRDLVAGA